MADHAAPAEQRAFRRVLKELKRAYEAAFASAAAASTLGLLDADRIRAFRAYQKAGAVNKVRSLGRAKELMRRCTAMQADMEQLLRTSVPMQPVTTATDADSLAESAPPIADGSRMHSVAAVLGDGQARRRSERVVAPAKAVASTDAMHSSEVVFKEAPAQAAAYAVPTISECGVEPDCRVELRDTAGRRSGKQPATRSLAAGPCTAAIEEAVTTTLTQHELNIKKLKIAREILRGSPARTALSQHGMAPTASNRRTASRWARQLRDTKDVNDRRLGNAGAAISVLTPEMRLAIEHYWTIYPRANATAIRHAIERHLERQREARIGCDARVESRSVGDLTTLDATDARGSRATRASANADEWIESDNSLLDDHAILPSTQSIRRAISDLGRAKRLLRDKGARAEARTTRPVLDRVWARRANERWEMDHSGLDVYVQEHVHGERVSMPVLITCIIDVFSRAIVAFQVSTGAADSMTVAMVMRKAMRPKHGTRGWSRLAARIAW